MPYSCLIIILSLIMFKTNQPKETMTKNKYATIQDLVPGKNFHFFNNFEDQVFKDKTININDVGQDWFDCLNDDQQVYVLQMPKYSKLDYDDIVKAYDKEVLPNVIKNHAKLGWDCDSEGNIIGFIRDKKTA